MFVNTGPGLWTSSNHKNGWTVLEKYGCSFSEDVNKQALSVLKADFMGTRHAHHERQKCRHYLKPNRKQRREICCFICILTNSGAS